MQVQNRDSSTPPNCNPYSIRGSKNPTFEPQKKDHPHRRRGRLLRAAAGNHRAVEAKWREARPEPDKPYKPF